MIRCTRELESLEHRWLAEYPADFARNLAILDGMYKLARELGGLPLPYPSEGLDEKIRFARAINGLKTPRGTRPGLG